MQNLKYLLYFIIAFIINGCCCGNNGNTYKSYDFYKVFMDNNDTFYLKAKYTFDDENQTFYLRQYNVPTKANHLIKYSYLKR